jgi:hypothetical protein
MKSYHYAIALFLATVARQLQDASALSQNAFSRKAFVSRVVSSAVVATTAGTTTALTFDPSIASAREGVLTARIKERASSSSSAAAASDATSKAGKKELFRGGKNLSDALHNGTDLDRGQAEVAGGLLDKMGLNDITPDKGPNSRAPPTVR